MTLEVDLTIEELEIIQWALNLALNKATEHEKFNLQNILKDLAKLIDEEILIAREEAK